MQFGDPLLNTQASLFTLFQKYLCSDILFLFLLPITFFAEIPLNNATHSAVAGNFIRMSFVRSEKCAIYLNYVIIYITRFFEIIATHPCT
jgi:hypothetical protein